MSKGHAQATPQVDFNEITQLIVAARQRAVQAVNTSLIELYWQVGRTISRKIAQAEWGDGVVTQLASHLACVQPGLRGFTRRNLFRMRQFYEAYQDEQLVSALLSQLTWTHHLIILHQSKSSEERMNFTCRMHRMKRLMMLIADIIVTTQAAMVCIGSPTKPVKPRVKGSDHGTHGIHGK